MGQLTTSAKQAIIEKALARDGRTLGEIAKCHNIGVSTLGKWLKIYRESGRIGQKNKSMNQDLLMSEQFEHLMATATLDAISVGKYCREKGIYSYQLTEWKEAFMTEKKPKKDELALAELKVLRAENKQLKQEVRRKDSALAEATSLLILKKKAALIWGEIGDD